MSLKCNILGRECLLKYSWFTGTHELTSCLKYSWFTGRECLLKYSWFTGTMKSPPKSVLSIALLIFLWLWSSKVCLSIMAAMRSFRLVSALSAQPLNHIHAIPAFIVLSFSHPLHIPSKLFSTAFDSTLQNPTSATASFESTPVAKFLFDECGFSFEDANNICRRKPDLLAHKSYDNSRKTLLFLRDKGFHEIGIQKVFSKFPRILRYSFHDNVKPKVEFLEKIGLTGQKLFKTLSRDPSFFGLSISRALEPRVCFLQSVLDPDLAIVVSNPASDQIPGSKVVSNHSLTVSAICSNPRILTLTTEKSLGIVNDVEGLGIEKGSKAFARAFLLLSKLNRDTVKRKLKKLRELGFAEEEVRILVKKSPELLSFSEDTLCHKLENLKELGFAEEEVRILVTKLPTLLGVSEDTLRQKLKFLVEEWKLPRSVILRYPQLLGLSMEKRLKPRLDAVRAINGCCEGLDGEERVFENSSKLSLHDRGGISSRSGGQARSIKHKRLVDLAAFD